MDHIRIPEFTQDQIIVMVLFEYYLSHPLQLSAFTEETGVLRYLLGYNLSEPLDLNDRLFGNLSRCQSFYKTPMKNVLLASAHATTIPASATTPEKCRIEISIADTQTLVAAEALLDLKHDANQEYPPLGTFVKTHEFTVCPSWQVKGSPPKGPEDEDTASFLAKMNTLLPASRDYAIVVHGGDDAFDILDSFGVVSRALYVFKKEQLDRFMGQVHASVRADSESKLWESIEKQQFPVGGHSYYTIVALILLANVDSFPPRSHRDLCKWFWRRVQTANWEARAEQSMRPLTYWNID